MSLHERSGGEAAAALVIMVVHYVWSAYVLVQLWTWFVVPIGAPEIAIGHACGLTVLICFLSGRMYDKDDGTPIGEYYHTPSQSPCLLSDSATCRTFG